MEATAGVSTAQEIKTRKFSQKSDALAGARHFMEEIGVSELTFEAIGFYEALGTGDLDFIYHFALPELIETVEELDTPDSLELLRIMLDGKRLRDISDLPLDFAI